MSLTNENASSQSELIILQMLLQHFKSLGYRTKMWLGCLDVWSEDDYSSSTTIWIYGSLIRVHCTRNVLNFDMSDPHSITKIETILRDLA